MMIPSPSSAMPGWILGVAAGWDPSLASATRRHSPARRQPINAFFLWIDLYVET